MHQLGNAARQIDIEASSKVLMKASRRPASKDESTRSNTSAGCGADRKPVYCDVQTERDTSLKFRTTLRVNESSQMNCSEPY